ncbi:MAG: DUF4065 domain-containing protein [Tannerella sp.]|jgi:uncharacterized phage-associated protein|nr:DUF4065 domain-containing protein [Tannerella sp.]
MKYTALDIANKLITKAADYNEGELMTNMKLQKMLYYEQGYHLGAFGTPLFEEDIEAWMYGPVVPDVYRHFKEYGAASIKTPPSDPVVLDSEEESLFNNVFEAYIDFSAIGLMNKTHQEYPWKSTPQLQVIPKEKIKEYFNGQLKKEKQQSSFSILKRIFASL